MWIALIMVLVFVMAGFAGFPWDAVASGGEAEGKQPFEVSVKLDDKTIELGKDIKLTVNIKNISGEDVTFPKPTLDLRSVSVGVTIADDVQFLHTHILEENGQPEDLGEVTLPADGETSLDITMPAIKAGEWKIQGALRVGQAMVTSPEVPLTVTGEGKEVICTMKSNKGEMIITFYPEAAPNHVMHFIKRAKEGKYNDNIFHRVIEGFMIQGGDPDGTGMGGPGYVLPAEFNDLPHTPGVLSAARRQDPHSAGCQFFLCHGSPDFLNGQYTVFGKVVEGIDIVNEIATVETNAQDRPLKDQVMEKLTVGTRDAK